MMILLQQVTEGQWIQRYRLAPAAKNAIPKNERRAIMRDSRAINEGLFSRLHVCRHFHFEYL